MIYASYDHNMPTFEVFLSFSFCFIFYVCKNYTSIAIYEKSFSLYTYIPIHDTLSLYTHVSKTLSLYINTVYITTLFLFKDFFFVFSTYTRGLYKNFFVYTHYSRTRISFHTLFTHTQNLSIHFFTYKKLFSFLYIYSHDICSQCLFLFSILGVIMIFVRFIFRTTFLKENSTRFQNFNKHYRQ